MGNQGPVVVSSQGGVEVAGQGQNVATARSEQAEEKKLSVDGKKIYPTDVFADTVHLKTDLTVGSGVALSDGCVQTKHLATDSVSADKISATGLTSTDISFSGTLSGFGIANLGTITGGSIAIGAGGATIGDVAAGVSISGNVIRCIKSAVVTIQIDGSTGIVTANKFQLTADSSSSLDMSLGSLTIGATASLNGTACSTVVTNAASGATAIQPNGTSGTTGTVVNASTRKLEKIYLNSSGIDITTAASGARLLMNSSGLNLYDSGGVNTVQLASDGSLTIQSASSGNRVVVTTSGLTVYKTGTTKSVNIAASTGVQIYNHTDDSTPGAHEKLSFYDNSETERLSIWAPYTGAACFITASSKYLQLQSNGTTDATITLDGGASAASILYDATCHYFRTAASAYGGEINVGTVTFEGGTVDPTVKAAAAPSEGGASSEPLGSLRLGVGGSLWYTYLDGATNKWTRIYSYQYHP